MTFTEGKLDLLEQVQKQKKAWKRLFELSAKCVRDRQIEPMCILNVNALIVANDFIQEIRSRMHDSEEISLPKLHQGYPSNRVLVW